MIKGNTTWKPAIAKRPMLINGPKLGQIQAVAAAPAIWAAVARWVIPFVAISAGTWLTSNVVSKSLPEIPINKKNIGLAAALAGAGGTAYFVAQGLPEKTQPWAYAAAVAGIAGSLYLLFQEPPQPYEPGYTQEVTGGVMHPDTPPQNCAVPRFTAGGGSVGPVLPMPEPVGPAQSGIRVTFDPNQTLTGSTTRSKYVEQEYVATFQNLNDEPRCFFIGLNIKDDDGDPTYVGRTDFPNGVSPTTPSPYQRQYVFLAPRGRTADVTTPDGKRIKVHDAESFKLKAPAYTEAASWNVLPILWSDVSIVVEMFRNNNDQKPFQVSNAINIRYGPIG